MWSRLPRSVLKKVGWGKGIVIDVVVTEGHQCRQSGACIGAPPQRLDDPHLPGPCEFPSDEKDLVSRPPAIHREFEKIGPWPEGNGHDGPELNNLRLDRFGTTHHLVPAEIFKNFRHTLPPHS
eukprot:CAMPEP_0194329952 /NCGR_PEP_ID=MMETSP0171-20130528/49932_1 /TAXON_ID=218684 /ORGANISM="Corethron pennatum, Strain L29A3" /LENGTH=122 /DNA_ID=CAMNT_0039090845 /DNA_START=193 /DNA_END=561 /DNA_ORIENTATION=+